MAWAFVGVSAAVTVTAAPHALTEPAGCQAGDLLVAVISSRIASTTSITLPAGWTLVAESKTNNVVAAATTSEASGMMAYIVRSDAAPALTFTHPTAPSVAMGRIVAYRGGNIWSPFDVGVGNKTGTAITAISLAGLTTGEANELIVRGVCSGRASAFSAFDAATDPTTSSGTGSVDTAAPTVGTWRERQDSSTTTGADTALAIADAIRGTAGATGNLTCTASVSGGHVQVSGAFRIEPVAVPAGSPVQWCAGGSNFIDFTASSTNSGTVSSTLDVPTDCELVVVGVQGWCATANYFTNMTFTKSGADTAMTRIGTTEPGNGQTAAIFYLALPDTGANKSLKFDWAGATAPGETPIISVTYWKNVDTASPVRSSGASLPAVGASTFKTRSALLTAQAGDLVVGFIGGDCGAPAEGSVDTYYNLDPLVNCTNGAAIRHDGAWATFPPSANLYVGADTATLITFGVCCAIVVKPKPAATAGSSTITQAGSTTQFSAVTGNSGTLSVTVPADAQIAVVGVLGRSDDTGFFDTNLTLTKGAADVAMTRVGPTGQTSSQTPVIYYLALPDTGAGKSLKYNWTGANAAPAGAEPTISVTFWKGVDTASPVRSSGWQGELSERFSATTPTLTAQTGDLVVGFAGGYGPGSEGTIDTWYNLNTVTQWTFSGPHDGAWGSFAPSGNVVVGASQATNLQYGVCAAIVLKPTLSKLVSFASNRTNAANSPLTVTIPATSAGDCIIYMGGCSGASAITVSANTGATGVHGTLGGVQTPRPSSSPSTDFDYIVGIIAAPAAGTTSVSLACSNSILEKELGVWVVRGLTNPTQDKGVYSINQGPGTLLVSGLTGTLAAAEEFAVAYGVAMAESTTGINTAQTGSGGFIADQITTPTFGSTFSHQDTTVTTQIQSAFNQTGGTGDALLATYYSGAAGVTGTLATTEAADVAAMTGNVTRIANLATTEAIDVTLINGTVRWAATLAETEDPDVAAINATVRWAATLAETEDPDVAALVGTVRWSGPLAVTEAPDVALINGTVVAPLVGDLATTEAPDVAALLGSISWQATLATTEAPDTALINGAVRWAATLATIEAPDVAAFTASVQWAATLAVVETPDVGAFTGGVAWQVTLAAIEAADVAALTGIVRDPISATLATTEAADIAALTGVVYVPVAGTLGAIEPADAAVFLGGVQVAGSLAATEGPDLAAFTATTRWAATLAASELPDIAALTGTVQWQATLSTTELPDVAAMTGTVRRIATLATTEAPDTAALTGTVRWVATLTTAEAADAAAFLGGIYGTGTLAVTEAADQAAMQGGIFATGTLAAAEAPDVYSGLGTVFGAGVGGNLASTEPADGAAFTGQITGVAGLLAATEPPDVAALVGTARWTAILGATEAPDSAAITVAATWLASLATTEARDTAAMLGGLRWVVTLATSEAPDQAAFTGIAGALPEGVVLATTEAPDLVAFTGSTLTDATLAATEAPDLVAFVGGIYADGILDTTERPDGALFTAEPPDIADAPGRILVSKQRRVRELASDERVRTLQGPSPCRDLTNERKRVRSLKYPIPRTYELVKRIDELTGV